MVRQIIQSLIRTRGGRWLIGWGVITGIALLTSTQLYMGIAMMGKPPSWTLALRRSFEDWYSMGVFVPGVLWLAARYPFISTRRGLWLGVHLAGAVAFSAGYISLHASMLHGQMSIEGTVFDFVAVSKKMLVHYLPTILSLYALLVAGHNGWRYYRRMSERELRTAELETQVVQARLEALRMQLNPHFLFNTLHTISSLVHENPSLADRTIARLSDLLRQTLNPSGFHEVPLSEEMEFLSRYLEIERTRFEEGLQIDLDIAPGTEAAMVPSLILQPLVENAIRHGLESRDGQGRISIRSSRVDDRLRIRITDNGQGFASDETGAPRDGIGLNNTRSRLNHLYGRQHAFQLLEADGGGAEVRLEIPWKTSGDIGRTPSSPA